MAAGAVRDCRQAFAAARSAAQRIEHDEGRARPLAGPDTWQGRSAQHWLTDWHRSANRLMNLLSSLGQEEQAAVRHTEKQAHAGSHA